MCIWQYCCIEYRYYYPGVSDCSTVLITKRGNPPNITVIAIIHVISQVTYYVIIIAVLLRNVLAGLELEKQTAVCL